MLTLSYSTYSAPHPLPYLAALMPFVFESGFRMHLILTLHMLVYFVIFHLHHRIVYFVLVQRHHARPLVSPSVVDVTMYLMLHAKMMCRRFRYLTAVRQRDTGVY